MADISRRNFLRLGLGAGAAVLCCGYFPSALLASVSAQPRAGAERERVAFDGVAAGAREWLEHAVSPGKAEAIAADSKKRFAALLTRVPDIGPHNRNRASLMEAVWLTAITQAMAAEGLPAEMAGRLFYDLCARDLAARPAAALRAQGAALFSAKGRRELGEWAAATKARKYPGDWVATAVFGDGTLFDVGYDYAECGAVKFFREHGVAGVAPYFCLNDFTLSRAQGTGLARAHTIGQGDALCDFRYRENGPVTQSWETEVPRFRKA